MGRSNTVGTKAAKVFGELAVVARVVFAGGAQAEPVEARGRGWKCALVLSTSRGWVTRRPLKPVSGLAPFTYGWGSRKSCPSLTTFKS